MKFKEVELKYSAQEIPFSVFKQFAENQEGLENSIIVSGYDHFFANKKDRESFCRHRVGPDLNQLTFKRKAPESSNNTVRTEHNLDLKPYITEDQVAALCNEFGYEYNTSIFKTCFVYKYEWYTLCYYIVADMDQKEVGRFIEIEASESYKWSSEDEAKSAIISIEKLNKIGLTHKNRLKKSLWEMFRKE